MKAQEEEADRVTREVAAFFPSYPPERFQNNYRSVGLGRVVTIGAPVAVVKELLRLAKLAREAGLG